MTTIFAAPVPTPYTLGYGWVPGIHRSQDYEVPVGTPVLAAAPGTILQTGDDGALGNTLRIGHANGYETLYGNLTSYTAHPGATVTTGQQIGVSGGAVGSPNAGDSTGPHVPFQIWHNGTPVNPAPLTTSTPGATPTAGAASFNVLNPLASLIPSRGALLRGAMYVAGGVCLIIAIVMIVSRTQVGQNAVNAGKAAAKDATLAAIAIPK